jgi:hypothetical protein
VLPSNLRYCTDGAGRSQTDQDTARLSPRAQVYINNLGTGNPLIINDIAAAIRNSSSKILDVGRHQPRQIQEIYIWAENA